MEDKPNVITEQISEISIRNVLLPVLKFTILTKYLQEGVLKARGSNSESHLAQAKTLVNHAIDAHTRCVKYLAWPQYFNVLKAHITMLNQESKFEKIVVRLLSSNLNNLDAGLPNIVTTIKNEMAKNKNQVMSKGIMQKLVNYEKEREKDLE